MATVLIYHNPRCSKSRLTLQLLHENNIDPKIIEYLKTPPSPSELAIISAKLEKTPMEFIRNKEAEFKMLNLDKFDGTNEELFKLMSDNPKLIERPIVVNGDHAAIGRPPESVLQLF